MRKSLRLLFCLLALGFAFVPAPEGVAQQGYPKVGGFKPVAANRPEVVEAARFAVAARGKTDKTAIRLISVESAEQAVVAGMIFRLCLKVEIEDTENNVDVTTNVRTEVFRSLQKQYQLRSWKEEDCGAEDDEQ